MTAEMTGARRVKRCRSSADAILVHVCFVSPLSCCLVPHVTCLGSWSLYKLLIAVKLRETLHVNTKSEMNVLSIGIHLC